MLLSLKVMTLEGMPLSSFRGETLFDGREIDPGVENPRYNEKAYSSANAGEGDGDKNIRVLRFAEVLLIRAEALNELGQSGDALSPFEQG